jgi:hypothetical protein
MYCCKVDTTNSTMHKVQKPSSMHFEKDPQFKREWEGVGRGEEEDDLNDLCYLHQVPVSCTNLVAKTKLNSIRT